MTTTDLSTGLGDVKAKTVDAVRAAEADPGASVVLVAVCASSMRRPTSRR